MSLSPRGLLSIIKLGVKGKLGVSWLSTTMPRSRLALHVGLCLVVAAAVGSAAAADAADAPAACLTKPGMTQAQCAALLREYATPGGKCVGAAAAPPKGKGQPVVWIGPGCASACARQAKQQGRSVKSVCGSKPTTLGDGGCKVATDCLSIGCKTTCGRQPNCQWSGGTEFMGVCRFKPTFPRCDINGCDLNGPSGQCPSGSVCGVDDDVCIGCITARGR